MQIQKIFSDYYDNERLYSVLMDEDELALFSEAKEAEEESHGLRDSLIGAGIGAGLGGATIGAAYGSGALAKKLGERRSKALGKVDELAAKIEADFKAGKISEAQATKKMGKLAVKRGNKMEAGFVEKNLGKFHGTKTMQWIKNNPGKASAIAAGVAALGAGAGYGISKLKNRKRNED